MVKRVEGTNLDPGKGKGLGKSGSTRFRAGGKVKSWGDPHLELRGGGSRSRGDQGSMLACALRKWVTWTGLQALFEFYLKATSVVEESSIKGLRKGRG